MIVKTTSKSYNITPDTKIFTNLGATGEAAYKAIAELIDNSLDARIAGQPVRVDVLVQNKGKLVQSIIVRDTAAGMDDLQIASAFTIARSQKTGSKIGRFGMGLKTAIASLGSNWSISSTPVGTVTQYSAKQSLADFVRKNRWSLDVLTHKSSKPVSHGTSVEITGCGNLNSTVLLEDLTNKLPELFRHFLLSNELHLYVNETQLKGQVVDVMEKGYIEFKTEIQGKEVHGWLGLRENQSPEYGFNMIRSNRVVERNLKVGFPADPLYGRFVAEVYLNDFNTNHHKTAFVKTDTAWAELEKYLTRISHATLCLAKELAIQDRRRIDPGTKNLINESLEQLLAAAAKDPLFADLALENFVRDKYGRFHNPNEPEKAYTAPTPRDPEAEKRQRGPNSVIKGWAPLNRLKATHEGVHLGSEAGRKALEYVDGTLKIYTNLDHPAYVEEYKYQCAMRDIREALATYMAGLRNEARGRADVSLPDYETCLDRLYRIQIAAGMINV